MRLALSFLALICLVLSACTTVKLDPNFSSAGGFASFFGGGNASFMHISATESIPDSEITENARCFAESGFRHALLRTPIDSAKQAQGLRI